MLRDRCLGWHDPGIGQAVPYPREDQPIVAAEALAAAHRLQKKYWKQIPFEDVLIDCTSEFGLRRALLQIATILHPPMETTVVHLVSGVL